MATSKREAPQAASTETLVRLIGMQLGICDQAGVLMPMWERRLTPIEGQAYTASSVLPRKEEALSDDVSADEAVRQLEDELALQQAGVREVESR